MPCNLKLGDPVRSRIAIEMQRHTDFGLQGCLIISPERGGATGHPSARASPDPSGRASKDKWAKYEPVLMPPVDYTAVARQVKSLIRSKSSTLKTAWLNLTSGPQPLQGTAQHVYKSDLAQPVAYTRGTPKFTLVYMEVDDGTFLDHTEPNSM
jgi:hypothetical protein